MEWWIRQAAWMTKFGNTKLTNIPMKSLTLISLLGSLVISARHAEANPESPMRDSVTQEQLLVMYRQASQSDPMRKQVPTKGQDPSVINQPKSLISQSDTLCYNGAVTLVPKRAVLQTPKNLGDRLKYVPGAKLMTWSEFYALNRGWITTVEVTRLQAEGNHPLTAETKKQLVKSGNLIVATFQGGPISVLPLKVPVEKASSTTIPKL